MSSGDPVRGARRRWRPAGLATAGAIATALILSLTAVAPHAVAAAPTAVARARLAGSIRTRLAVSIDGIACPTRTRCYAVASGFDGHGTASYVVSSTHPGGGPGAWRARPVNGIATIACAGAEDCLGADLGVLKVSTDPTGGASAWRRVDVKPGLGLQTPSLACPSVALCLVTSENGSALLVGTDPFGPDAHWRQVPVEPAQVRHRSILNLSCASTSLCVAVDNRGDAITSTDPAGGRGAWRFVGGIDGHHLIWEIDCPTVHLCVAGDDHGQILTSTEPSRARSPWTVGRVARASDGKPSRTAVFDALSCPDSGHCFADAEDRIYSTSDPTVGARSWKRGQPVVHGLESLACPTRSLCVAGGVLNYLMSSGRPASDVPWRRIDLLGI